MRGVINFSMQKKLLNHFYMYGTKPYHSYVTAGYPSGDVLAGSPNVAPAPVRAWAVSRSRIPYEVEQRRDRI